MQLCSEPILRLAQDLREELPTLHGLCDVLRGESFLPNEPAPGPTARGRQKK